MMRLTWMVPVSPSAGARKRSLPGEICQLKPGEEIAEA